MANCFHVRSIFVAKRRVEQQVLGGAQSLGFKHRRAGWADAFDVRQWCFEIQYTFYQMAGTLSAALADISVPDPDGREWRLGSLWERQPAVIVFLRHY